MLIDRILMKLFCNNESLKRVIYNRISKSGLLNPEWYLQNYTDVAAANIDPLEHYLRYGWKEGRDPSDCFSTQKYLEKYSWLKEENICPLTHYCMKDSNDFKSSLWNDFFKSFLPFSKQDKGDLIAEDIKEDDENPKSETWGFIKNKYLNIEPKEVNFEDLDKTCVGRLRIGIGITKFEACLLPSKVKKLYVFFTAAGNGNNYPTFHRASWAIRFDGICLCLDDPARNGHVFEGAAFYFGDKNHNYLDYALNIVRKIQSVYDIKSEDITFISSSNGGFAAIYVANRVPGCKCIALNPRIDITKRFKKQFNFSDADILQMRERLDVTNFLHNEKTKFFLYFNNENELDYLHCKRLINAYGKPVRNGLTCLSKNIMLLVVNINAVDPHLVQPNWNFVKFIESIMGKRLSKSDLDLCYKLVDNMRKTAQIDIIKRSLSDSLSEAKK